MSGARAGLTPSPTLPHKGGESRARPGEPLVILTFKWGSRYTARHVNVLRSMLARHLRLDHEIVCVTDDCAGIDPAVRIVPLNSPVWAPMRDARRCGVRIRAFAADMAEIVGPRFAWIDLDVVVTGDVTPIFARTEDFVITATPRPPLPYNGSIVLMAAGARRQVYETWTEADYTRRGEALGRARGVRHGTVSDEGWIACVLGDHEATWTRDDGIFYFRRDLDEGRKALPADARIVLLNGRRFDPSFPELQRRCPWIAEHWR